MLKRRKSRIRFILLIGLIILLLLVLFSREDQSAKVRTNEKNIEQIKKQIDDRFDKLEKDIKQIKITKASSTAKKKAATPTPQPNQAVVYPVSCERYRPLVAKYNWDINTALRIMGAESGCSPTGHNWNDTHRNYLTGTIICKGSWGLFNIGCVHGYSREYLENPANNVAVAYKVYSASNGFYPWTTY